MIPHPGQLHPTQRFDRDAVKAMLLDAMWGRASYYPHPEITTVTYEGEINMDRLADTVLEWFGGKGAA